MAKNRNNNRPKQPRTALTLGDSKTPRLAAMPNYETEKLLWSVSILDFQGRWGWANVGRDTISNDILPKLRNFESMTWGEINHTKTGHPIYTKRIVAEAQKRLTELGLDDHDVLFRLELNGLQRIWGVRVRQVLCLLWWDPNHEIYPCFKKGS